MEHCRNLEAKRCPASGLQSPRRNVAGPTQSCRQPVGRTCGLRGVGRGAATPPPVRRGARNSRSPSGQTAARISLRHGRILFGGSRPGVCCGRRLQQSATSHALNQDFVQGDRKSGLGEDISTASMRPCPMSVHHWRRVCGEGGDTPDEATVDIHAKPWTHTQGRGRTPKFVVAQSKPWVSQLRRRPRQSGARPAGRRRSPQRCCRTRTTVAPSPPDRSVAGSAVRSDARRAPRCPRR
ncbi:hypothetical protein BN973_03956 [Mycobacterium triplex]|uniref:Uncharacterized protein n=1 Tax=Mycobacterium triplex TaxID=47839 RepID=A0A024K1X5_9MYCO|nr:hypothetical protein BN973_03956 [Mycobacterium triplex]